MGPESLEKRCTGPILHMGSSRLGAAALPAIDSMGGVGCIYDHKIDALKS